MLKQLVIETCLQQAGPSTMAGKNRLLAFGLTFLCDVALAYVNAKITS
jgi:hypothetical protein